MTKVQLTPRLYFSYGQFLVYDQSVVAPGCLWTERHTEQGFARRKSTVCFGTLLEFGYADVNYRIGRLIASESYERVIAVPFVVVTGKVVVDGPEENDVQRLVELPPGNYRLVSAQRALADDEEVIDLFFEKVDGLCHLSEIIVADEELDGGDALLETADVA